MVSITDFLQWISFFFFFCKLMDINPFLPNLATAVLACWPETAVRQPQKTDCLNPKGCYMPCRTLSVSKFRKLMKNWMVISIRLILSLLGAYFFNLSHDFVWKTSSRHILTRDTTYWAIFLLVLGSFAAGSSLASLDSLLGLYSWALFPPLSSKLSIFMSSGKVTVLFLNISLKFHQTNDWNKGSMIMWD